MQEPLRHRIGSSNLVMVIKPVIEKGSTNQHLLQSTYTSHGYAQIKILPVRTRFGEFFVFDLRGRKVVRGAAHDFELMQQPVGVEGDRHARMVRVPRHIVEFVGINLPADDRRKTGEMAMSACTHYEGRDAELELRSG